MLFKDDILNALNLSDSEKAVLQVLESQKMAGTVTTIARKAAVPRTTTIYILRRFAKWQLVREIRQEKHSRWMMKRNIVAATDP